MGSRIDELIEKLSGKEYFKKPVGEAINGIAYRLLEQTRLGNKDIVYYLLLRCFKANNEKFPEDLIEVFKQENDKYFKILIFSFLAPILKEEKQGGK